jgi:hypothetical protein
MWRSIAIAPFGSELELAVIDGEGVHSLVFPCRRVAGGWVDARTGAHIAVWPTHWRPWSHGVNGDESEWPAER